MKFKVILGIIGIMFMSRLLFILPNFTSVTALFLFSGFYFKGWSRITVPILGMVITDLVLALMNPYGIPFLDYLSFQPFVYVALLPTLLLGMNTKKVSSFLFLAPVGSIAFFVLSNLFVWPVMYPLTIEGLLACYTLALPFFRNSLLGDVFYILLLAPVFEYILSPKQKLLTIPA